MEKFDLIVIGGGPGGYVGAIYGAQQGLKTALVEKADLGGTCLNWGCIPTKALARNAEVLRTVKEANTYGISFDQESLKADYSVAQKRSREVAAKLVKGIQGLIKKNKITLINGKGSLISPTKVKIEPEGKIIEGKNIILATGSHPFKIPGFDYTTPKIMTSKEALELSEIAPGEKIVIIGAGAIGMEFGSIWESYGAEITIVEQFPNVLPKEDEAVSKEIEKAFKKRKIQIKTGTTVKSIRDNGESMEITIEKNGKSEKLNCSKVLVSVGVKANVQNIGLEEAGVKLTKRALVEVDEHFRTTCKSIYAIGDITGKLPLAHVASAQALAAIHDILGKPVKKINYDNIPRCTYTYPEAASVGLTEAQAKEQGYDVKVGNFPMAANGKSLAMNETTGFIKIVADKKYNEILGVHLVGSHVSELINAPTAYIDLEITANEIAEVIHPHPSVSEVIMEAAHSIVGQAIHF